MIHRFEVNPPRTTVLIYADPRREDRDAPGGPMFERDRYINCRMVGGRNETGEFRGPCLITVDDDTEAGRWQLEQIRHRIAEGRLPGVSAFQPGEVGLSDEQLDELVERRARELLEGRGYVEAPSDEARELLDEGADAGEQAAPGPIPAPTWQGMTPARVRAEIVDVTRPRIERVPDGRLRCPLDRRLFAQGVAWAQHWQRSSDPEHARQAQTMIEAV